MSVPAMVERCGACLSRERQVSPLRPTHIAHARRMLGERHALLLLLPVCWECRALVDKSLLFCERARQAADSLLAAGAESLRLDDNSDFLSSLGSRSKIGFDFELIHSQASETNSECDSNHTCCNVHSDASKSPTTVQTVALKVNENRTSLVSQEKGLYSSKENSCAVQEIPKKSRRKVTLNKSSFKDKIWDEEDYEIKTKRKTKSNKIKKTHSKGKIRVDYKKPINNLGDPKTPARRNKLDLRKNVINHSKIRDKEDYDIKPKIKTKSNKIKTSNSKVKVRFDYRKPANKLDDVGSKTPARRNKLDIRKVVLSYSEMMRLREEDRNNEQYKKSLFRCETCLVGFLNEAILEEHNMSKHSEEAGPHACDVCAARFPSETKRARHHAAHQHQYVCRCGFARRGLLEVRRHAESEHELAAAFPCRQCDKLFIKYPELKIHRLKAHWRPKGCPHCGVISPTWSEYSKHISYHARSKPYACAVCGRQCAGRSALATHMRAHAAPGADDAYCAECGLQFKTKYTYANHLRTSLKHVSRAERKWYQCDKCNKKFHGPTELRYHIDRIHLELEAFKCDKCLKNFGSPRSLRAHVQRFHCATPPPRDKVCEECGRGFRCTSTLVSHRRTHTGERPYACAQCGATFRQSGALYRHEGLLHGARRGRS